MPTSPAHLPDMSSEAASNRANFNYLGENMQASGNAIQICDATTGHCVANVAFCDTPERAASIVEMVAALRQCAEHMKWETQRGRAAYEAAHAALEKAGIA